MKLKHIAIIICLSYPFAAFSVAVNNSPHKQDTNNLHNALYVCTTEIKGFGLYPVFGCKGEDHYQAALENVYLHGEMQDGEGQ